jgi:hypothetical protein
VDEARRLGVDIKPNSHVTSVDFSRPAVRFGDGQEDFEADLVIGADGLKSVTRETLLGRKDPPRLTGDLAYRIIVKASDIRRHPSLLSLVETPAITIWMGPDSHAVGYLLKGGDLYNIVLCCPDNLPEMVNTQKADLDEMRGIFAGWDERLRTLLGLVTETSKWRLQNIEEMDQWVAREGTFALLGDACHATLPYLYILPSPFNIKADFRLLVPREQPWPSKTATVSASSSPASLPLTKPQIPPESPSTIPSPSTNLSANPAQAASSCNLHTVDRSSTCMMDLDSRREIDS